MSHSASETLRALLVPMTMADMDVSYEDNARRSFEATLMMREALPLIADVVEAAERAQEYAFEPEARKAAAVVRAEIAPALTALREHLDGER